MRIIDFMLELENKGIQLKVHQNQLKVLASKGILNDEILERIKLNKYDLIKFLNDEKDDYGPILSCREKPYYNLSSAQKRLFIVQTMNPQSTAYNMPMLLPLPYEIDSERLSIIFNQLINRHESLRTTFPMFDGTPQQKISPNLFINVDLFETTQQQLSVLYDSLIQPFDLSVGPLIRIAYLKLADDHNYIFIDIHHIVTDGISQDILKEDFFSLVRGEALPPMRLQYKDYSEWQNNDANKGKAIAESDYWLELFSGDLPELKLPLDFNRPKTHLYDGANVYFDLTDEENIIINNVAKDFGVTIYTVLMAVFNVFLSKVSLQKDVIIGTPSSGRSHSDLNGIVGMFVNTLAIRTYVDPNSTLRDFLNNLKKNIFKALDNQWYQFDDLVANVYKDRVSSQNPFFNVMFNLLNAGDYFSDLGDLNSELIHYKGTSKFDLTLTAIQSEKGIKLNLCYSTSLFKPQTINRFISFLRNIVRAFKKSDITLSAIRLHEDEEEKKLLYSFNRTKKNYDNTITINQLFEAQVKLTPNKSCLIFSGKTITFLELNEKSNQLARFLTKKGAGKESVVGLWFDTSPDMIIAMMATIKCGAAYLPINNEFPEARVNYVLKDAAIKLLLTNKKSYLNLNVTEVIEVSEKTYTGDNHDLNCDISSVDPLYIIYTSGTTGDPKGVIITHENLLNYNDWFNSIFNTTGETTALLTSYAFDLGYTVLFPSLLNGGTIHLLFGDIFDYPSKLVNYLSSSDVTFLKLTPSFYSTILGIPAFEEVIKKLKLLVLGGENINVDAVEQSLALNNQLKILNHYGPTEGTIGCITYLISKENIEQFKSRPVIGYPINNVQVYILDNNLEILPIGIFGNLYLGGDGLSAGYYNDLKLTRSKFISNPYDKGNLIYETGDLARWTEMGTIEFYGRSDNQIKIRGFRIDIKEIEKALLSHSAVAQCAIVPHGKGADTYLCAYVVTSVQLNEVLLNSFLTIKLPSYMIPQRYEFLNSLPLTRNGKIDIKLLKASEVEVVKSMDIPFSDTEEKLALIWSELLSVPFENINKEMNFFSIGGDSLKVIRLISKINAIFKIEVSIKDIFLLMTVKDIAKIIDHRICPTDDSMIEELQELSDEEIKKLLGE